jgi:hypothetical protein
MLAFSLLLLASLVSFSHGHGRSSANAQERFSLSSSPGSAAKPAIMAAEWSFVDCGESSDHAPQVKSVLYLNDSEGEPTDAVELLSFEVSPDPPVPGKDLTIKVKGIAHTRIEVRPVIRF